MVSPTDIAAMFTATRSAFDLGKSVKAMVDKVGDADTKYQMADLISKLADAKVEAATASARIAELEQLLATVEAMNYDGMVYWQGQGDDRDGPFCQRCFDDSKKVVRLQKGHSEYRAPWSCVVCGTSYGKSKPPPTGGLVVRA